MDLQFPADLKYTAEHEWVRSNGDGSATVGITAFAADQLGDVTYVELPKVGTAVTKGGSAAAVESVKAASDVYAPLAGTVSAVNDRLEGEPELVNGSPYNDGWFFKIKGVSDSDLDGLMSADEYGALVKEQAE